MSMTTFNRHRHQDFLTKVQQVAPGTSEVEMKSAITRSCKAWMTSETTRKTVHYIAIKCILEYPKLVCMEQNGWGYGWLLLLSNMRTNRCATTSTSHRCPQQYWFAFWSNYFFSQHFPWPGRKTPHQPQSCSIRCSAKTHSVELKSLVHGSTTWM